MSNCALNFAFANEEESYVIKEGACGPLTKPSITDQFLTVGPLDFEQPQEFNDDEQIRASASRLSPLKGRKNPGTLSMNTYVKPSGDPGVAPEADVLFDCLMGDKQVNPGVSVVYTLTDQLDSCSIWTKKGHTVFAFRGTTIGNAEFGISGDTIAGVGWTAAYMEQGYAGTVVCNDTCGIGKGTIQLPSKAAQLYTEGMFVIVGDDDNSDAGYELTDVNYTNDTITISPGLVTDQGVNPEITPWWPASGSELGTPVHGKLGMVTIGGADAVVLTANVTMANNIKYYTDEKNNVWTAERFGRPKFREIDGNIEFFFMERGPSYFYRAEYQVSDALVIPAGNVAGYIMQIDIPYAEYGTPKVAGDEEFRMTVDYKAIADSSDLNGEMTITFK